MILPKLSMVGELITYSHEWYVAFLLNESRREAEWRWTRVRGGGPGPWRGGNTGEGGGAGG